MTYTVKKFLEYVSYPTMSNESSESCPSSEKQLVLAKRIVEDLKALGLSDAFVDAHGYVYATLPANTDKKAPVLRILSLPTEKLFWAPTTRQELQKSWVRLNILLKITYLTAR